MIKLMNCLALIQIKKIFTREIQFRDPKGTTSTNINTAGNKLNRSLGNIMGMYIHESVNSRDGDDNTILIMETLRRAMRYRALPDTQPCC